MVFRVITLAALLAANPVAAKALVVDMTGTWAASTGTLGEMEFKKNNRVELRPAGLGRLSGKYTISGEWLEILPDGGRAPATMRVSCVTKNSCSFTYTDGTSQTFVRAAPGIKPVRP